VSGLSVRPSAGREVAGDAADAEAIAAVRRDRDLEHRVGRAEKGVERRADGRLARRQDEEAVLALAEAEFFGGAHHARRIDVAEASRP
jgi:hypothetical protein